MDEFRPEDSEFLIFSAGDVSQYLPVPLFLLNRENLLADAIQKRLDQVPEISIVGFLSLNGSIM